MPLEVLDGITTLGQIRHILINGKVSKAEQILFNKYYLLTGEILLKAGINRWIQVILSNNLTFLHLKI